MDLLRQMGQDQRVIIDAALSPKDAAAAFAAGTEGVVLSECLWALPEMALPKVFLDRLGRLDSGSFHHQWIPDFGLSLAPVLRRLLDGEGFLVALAQGGWSEDPTRCAWPTGPGVSAAVSSANFHGFVAGVIGAYRSGIHWGLLRR